MRKFTYLAMFVAILFVIGGCGAGNQNHSLDDMQRLSTTNDNTDLVNVNDTDVKSDNPRSINQVGETWGKGHDRQKIVDSLAGVNGAEVSRVTFFGNTARVTVNIDEDLSEENRQIWYNKIKQTIEKAMPRYKVKLNLK